MITIELPRSLVAPLRADTRYVLEEPCDTVGDALAALGRRAPGVLDRMMDEQGQLRQHVNVFVGDENIRYMSGLGSPVPDGSSVTVIGAVSGG